MQLKYKCHSLVGTFYIGESSDGRFHPIYNSEDLGSYYSANHAAEDLSLNETFSVVHPVSGRLIDTSAIGIPGDVSEWQRV